MDPTSLDFEWRATVERTQANQTPTKHPTPPPTFEDLLANAVCRQEDIKCE